MGLLTTAALDEILGAGCPCGSHKLEFTTYVDGRFTMLDGEQFGGLVWAYKGETFVDGVFEASCLACKKPRFSSDVCPRCNREGALPQVLATANALDVPTACPRCDAKTLLYTVMLPARVVYEGRRAQKARATVDLVEEGAHGVHVDCKACGVLAEVTGRCPLCTAPGPLRPRPH